MSYIVSLRHGLTAARLEDGVTYACTRDLFRLMLRPADPPHRAETTAHLLHLRRSDQEGGGLSGGRVLRAAEELAARLQARRMTLHDAALRVTEDGCYDLSLRHMLRTGKTWYEARGYTAIPCEWNPEVTAARVLEIRAEAAAGVAAWGGTPLHRVRAAVLDAGDLLDRKRVLRLITDDGGRSTTLRTWLLSLPEPDYTSVMLNLFTAGGIRDAAPGVYADYERATALRAHAMDLAWRKALL